MNNKNSNLFDRIGSSDWFIYPKILHSSYAVLGLKILGTWLNIHRVYESTKFLIYNTMGFVSITPQGPNGFVKKIYRPHVWVLPRVPHRRYVYFMANFSTYTKTQYSQLQQVHDQVLIGILLNLFLDVMLKNCYLQNKPLG